MNEDSDDLAIDAYIETYNQVIKTFFKDFMRGDEETLQPIIDAIKEDITVKAL